MKTFLIIAALASAFAIAGHADYTAVVHEAAYCARLADQQQQNVFARVMPADVYECEKHGIVLHENY